MTRRLLLLIAFVIVAAALLFVPIPIGPTYAARTIEDAGHTPLFFAGTLFVLAILRHDLRVEGLRLYLLAALLGGGAGLLSEIIQMPLQRDASWVDVFADWVGVLLALMSYLLYDRRAAADRLLRVTAVLVIAGCLVVYVAPVVSMLRAYAHRDGQFPVLASFDSRLELYWIVSYGIRREIRDGALEVEFDAPLFPGFSFHEPVPDWRRYRTLAIDVENPDAALPLKMGIRVHDARHAHTYADRFNRSFDLAPTERRVLRIPLEEIRRGPRNRLMDMAHISDVTLFRLRDSPSQRMRLHNMRLE
ncbi:MAG TPA: hypothetical protein VFS13_09915 [Steroidobacteraceae bacterium]|nr:hypothetical protein [Steroidobacteraceae bacterium]